MADGSRQVKQEVEWVGERFGDCWERPWVATDRKQYNSHPGREPLFPSVGKAHLVSSCAVVSLGRHVVHDALVLEQLDEGDEHLPVQAACTPGQKQQGQPTADMAMPRLGVGQHNVF